MSIRIIAVAVACLAASAATASAHREAPRRDGQCIQGCREAFRECSAAGRVERRACHQGCSALIEAAKAACADTVPGAEPSAECVAARVAARACLAPCREGFADDRDTCVTTLRSCISSCPAPDRATPRPTPSVDRACLGECRQARHECFESVRESAEVCRRTTCGAESDAVGAACRRRGSFAECRAAQAALAACLEPCGRATGEGARACAVEAESCAAGCVAPTPVPDSTPGS